MNGRATKNSPAPANEGADYVTRASVYRDPVRLVLRTGMKRTSPMSARRCEVSTLLGRSELGGKGRGRGLRGET